MVALGCNQTLLGLVASSYFEFVLRNVHLKPLRADCALESIVDCDCANCNLERVFVRLGGTLGLLEIFAIH